MDRHPLATLADRVRAAFRRRPPRRPGWVTPFVVTRDSAPRIVPLLTLYREAGLEPHVILDDRSTDGTGAALARGKGVGDLIAPSDPQRVRRYRDGTVDEERILAGDDGAVVGADQHRVRVADAAAGDKSRRVRRA